MAVQPSVDDEITPYIPPYLILDRRTGCCHGFFASPQRHTRSSGIFERPAISGVAPADPMTQSIASLPTFPIPDALLACARAGYLNRYGVMRVK